MRRTAARLVYERFEGTIAGDKGFMTYQQACSIFGFEMSDRVEVSEIKKRFNKLVLRFHPDHGGTNEQFLLLREAHKILLTHRHDKGDVKGDKGAEVKFRRMNYDNMTNTIHRQTADKREYRSFSAQDFVFFLGLVTFVILFYFYRAMQTHLQILRSRWSYTEDMLHHEEKQGDIRGWHPWRADRPTRDTMDDIGLLQQSISREMLEEKRRFAPMVHMPWKPSIPFSSSGTEAHLRQ
uniref:Uncharacterized protein TCIL3000_4_270 n=1 Tax=Trypanosoma congolense (strain IL3000) TaxID=1068625 RepID=G0UKP0_TRYCI|nr:unnamed protein product [Trypanosoma congolense IL3000]